MSNSQWPNSSSLFLAGHTPSKSTIPQRMVYHRRDFVYSSTSEHPALEAHFRLASFSTRRS